MNDEMKFESLGKALESMPTEVALDTQNVVNWWKQVESLIEELDPVLFESQKNIYGKAHGQDPADIA